MTTTQRLTVAILALLLAAACGKSEAERRAEELRQTAEQFGQNAQNVAKGLEELTKGLGGASTALAELGAAAQAANQQANPDLAEYKAYRLSLPVLKKVEAATRAFAATIKSDPRYRAFVAASQEYEALDNKADRSDTDEARMAALEKQIKASPFGPDDDGDQSLDALVAEIEKMPPMAQALKANDVTPREWAKFTGVAFQAYLVAGSQEALKGSDPGSQLGNALVTGLLGSNLAPENVAFVKTNRAAVEQLMQVMQELSEP